MATNHYFQTTPRVRTDEQRLIEDLVIEAIQQYGTDVYYLPRSTLGSVDNLYGEDTNKYFNKAYSLEMYPTTFQGFSGVAEIFNSYGNILKDPFKLMVARRTFKRYIPETVVRRPREGDLIWVPVLNNIFEITFVDDAANFHVLGRPAGSQMFFEIHLELFKYNNERFRTGIEEIDQLSLDYSYTIAIQMSTSGSGAYTVGERIYQGSNIAYANTVATVKSWDRTNKILQIINIKGEVSNGVAFIGNTSSASYTVQTAPDRKDFTEVTEELADNVIIDTEGDDFLDFSTGNPFGTPD